MLNPAAKIAEATQEYAQRGFTRIENFLELRLARQLARELRQWQDWNLLFRDGDRHFDLLPRNYRELSPQLYSDLVERVTQAARNGFQYFYYNIALFDQLKAGRELTPLQAELCALLQSPAFLAAARSVTGAASIAFADFQVTKYVPGNFLTTHNDDVDGKKRVAAYVLSLSSDWKPDWGGLLHLLDADDRIEHSLVPSFNTLTLFSVPRRHLVSCVSPFAGNPRLSVTGWLRGR